MRNRLSDRIISNVIVNISAGIAVLFVVIPFLWALSLSLKREGDVFKLPLRYFPSPVTFENYINAWKQYQFSIYFRNSLIIALISVFFIILLSMLNGYVLSRYRFKGRKTFMLLLFCTQMIPGIFTIIPLFIMFRGLGLTNSPLGIIIAYIGGGIPFNTLLMFGFVNNLPKEIDEAAMVDGANKLRTIFRIVMPILLPGIVATSAFAFIGCWNEFFTAFAFISSRKAFTIPIALRLLLAENVVQLASMAAQCMIALVPPLVLFAFIQKYLVQGLGSGAVKG